MADGDTTVGPTVTLDGNGNAILSFTAIQQLNDTIIAVTTTGGQLLVPVGSFVGSVPPNTTTANTCVVSSAYAKSQSLI